MSSFDDFFAFHEDAVDVKPEKKKRKKKKPKTMSPSVSFNSKLEQTETSATPDSTELGVKGETEPIKADKSNVISFVEEELLSGLLGLSEPSKPTPKPSKDTRSNHRFQFVSLSDDDEGTPAMEESMKTEDDGFLAEMNNYLDSALQQDQETAQLLESNHQEKVIINGVVLESKAVKFEFHVVVEAAGQVSGAYDLQVKGSTKITKLIVTLMDMFNQTANPTYPPEYYSSLVFYIKSLNVILKQGLKIMSLLSYKNLLDKSSTVTGYEVDAMITTEEYAQMLLDEENLIRKHKEQEYDTNNVDDTISLVFEDMQSESDPKSRFSLDLLTKMKFSEVIEIYKFQNKLPSRLKLEIFGDNEIPIDNTKSISESGISEDNILYIKYDITELKQLTQDDELSTANGNKELDNANQSIDDIEYDRDTNDDGKPQEEYFTVFLVGKDRKRYKVDIKPSTKIADLANFYIQKAQLPPSTKLTLCFDDEDLDLSGVVADTELEDEYMIDVLY